MQKAKKQKEKTPNELVMFVLVMSIAIFVGFSGYSILLRISETKSQVCNALGKVWVTEQMQKENPEKSEGCYTYEEFYQ